MPSFNLLPRENTAEHPPSVDRNGSNVKLAVLILPIIFVSLTIIAFAVLCIRMKRRKNRVPDDEAKEYPQPAYLRIYQAEKGYGYSQAQPTAQPTPPPQAHLNDEFDAPPLYREKELQIETDSRK
jgi:hypothetical protein